MRLPIEAEQKGWSFGPIEELRAEITHMKKILPRANAAGLKIVLGDDYGTVILEHGRQNEELSFYVRELGIPPLDVIRWATKNGAELMGRGHDLGTIAAGKIADLLIVDGNPLENMSLLDDKTNLLAIIKGGAFMKDELTRIPTTGRTREVV
jgi:imidazolonepropionase-like amidohydrolase